MLEFKKITMDDMQQIKACLGVLGQNACEFTFGNNVLWDMDHELDYAIENKTLIYRLGEGDKYYYCLPTFNGKASEVLDKIAQDAKACARDYELTCLSEAMVEEIKECSDEYEFSYNEDRNDYIYLVEKMASLSGKKLHKKKNHLNQFVKNYEFEYETMTAENAYECIAMNDEWLEKRLEGLAEGEDEGVESLKYENGILKYALENFEKFGFVGGLIRVYGKVVAFTLGEAINDETFDTHFEKAFGEYNGLYVAMNQQFSEHELLGRYKYVNREDDLGLPGLRQAKSSYYPEMLWNKWNAKRR